MLAPTNGNQIAFPYDKPPWQQRTKTGSNRPPGREHYPVLTTKQKNKPVKTTREKWS
jgi:hypothetical protein